MASARWQMPGCKCFWLPADWVVLQARLIAAPAVMWPSGLSSDIGGSVLIYFRLGLMKVSWQAETSESLSLSPRFLNLQGDWSYLPPCKSIFQHQCVEGKANKTALLFLSITRISTRFSEIPPRAVRISEISPPEMFPNGLFRSVTNSCWTWMQFWDFSVFIWSWNDRIWSMSVSELFS